MNARTGARTCARPYGKDAFPTRTPLGYLPPARYGFMRQASPVRFSAYTTWEAPDPSFWVPRGYALVNVDPAKNGTSDGTGVLKAEAEVTRKPSSGRRAAMVKRQGWAKRRVVSSHRPK